MRYIYLLVLFSGLMYSTIQPVYAQEADTKTISLHYVTPESLKDYKPVPTWGYDAATGKKLKISKANFSGQIPYGEETVTFQIQNQDKPKPKLKVDLNRNGALEKSDVIPNKSFSYRTKGGLTAAFDITMRDGRARRLRLHCIFYKKIYAIVSDLGAYRGELTLGEGESARVMTLWMYDTLADGNLQNDKIFLDVDGDGRIVKCEELRMNEQILVGGYSLRFTSVDVLGTTLTVSVEPRPERSVVRDIPALLKKEAFVGNRIPEFYFKSDKGDDLARDDFEGKVLLMMFWNSTIKDISKELQAVQALLKKHGENGLMVLGVNSDAKKEDMAATLEKNTCDFSQWNVGRNPLAARQRFLIESSPEYILMGRDGIILSRFPSITDGDMHAKVVEVVLATEDPKKEEGTE